MSGDSSVIDCIHIIYSEVIPGRGVKSLFEAPQVTRRSSYEWARNNQPGLWVSNPLQTKTLVRQETGIETIQKRVTTRRRALRWRSPAWSWYRTCMQL